MRGTDREGRNGRTDGEIPSRSRRSPPSVTGVDNDRTARGPIRAPGCPRAEAAAEPKETSRGRLDRLRRASRSHLLSVAQALKLSGRQLAVAEAGSGQALEGSNKAGPAERGTQRLVLCPMRMRVVSANRHVQLLSENRQQGLILVQFRKFLGSDSAHDGGMQFIVLISISW